MTTGIERTPTQRAQTAQAALAEAEASLAAARAERDEVIRALRSRGLSRRQVAEAVGVSVGLVAAVCGGSPVH